MSSGSSSDDKAEFLAKLASRDGIDPETILDFSGLSIANERLDRRNMSYGLYNGCTFERLEVLGSDLSGSEFCETEMRGCTFEDCTFQSSDLIEARVSDCAFRRCSFKDGEWRESAFDGCRFEDCTFVYTTMALCTYAACSFDAPSSGSFVGPSKRYNVFLDTSVMLGEDEHYFLDKNIGIVGQDAGTFEPMEGQDPFTVLSVRMFLNDARAVDIVQAAINAVERISAKDTASAYTRLKYVVLATKKFVEARRLSLASTLYLSDRLVATSHQSSRHDIGMEVASLVIFCRQHVLEEMEAIRAEMDRCESVSLPPGSHGALYCETSYDEVSAKALLSAVERMMDAERGSVQVTAVTRGSTLIEFVVAAPVTAADWFKAVAYLGRGVKVLYRHARESIEAWHDLKRKRAQARAASTSQAITLVQAVNTFDTNPDIRKVRVVLHQGADVVLRLEGRIELHLVAQN